MGDPNRLKLHFAAFICFKIRFTLLETERMISPVHSYFLLLSFFRPLLWRIHRLFVRNVKGRPTVFLHQACRGRCVRARGSETLRFESVNCKHDENKSRKQCRNLLLFLCRPQVPGNTPDPRERQPRRRQDLPLLQGERHGWGAHGQGYHLQDRTAL